MSDAVKLQKTIANREKVAGRKQAIEIYEHLMNCSPEYVRGFIEILNGSLPELEAKAKVTQ